MKNYFKRTKMLDEAKSQSKGRRPLFEMLFFFLVYAIGSTAQGVFIYPAIMIHLFNSVSISDFIDGTVINQEKLLEFVDSILSSLPEWITIVSLFSTYALIVTVIVYCRCFEKRSLSSMGLGKRRAVSEYFFGILIGAIMFLAVAGLGYYIGAFNYGGFTKVSLPIILIYFIGFVIQGMSEEILIHGYYMTSVCRTASPLYALLSSSLMFALLHWSNSGMNIISFINLFLFGTVMGIYVLRRGNIWGVCAIHSVWNFMQGNVFGLSVSGMSKMSSVFSFSSKEGVDTITGGAFGPEGGLLVTLVLFLALGAVFIIKTKETEISDMSFDDESDGTKDEEND